MGRHPTALAGFGHATTPSHSANSIGVRVSTLVCVTLEGLVKNFGGISTIYEVTNLSATSAHVTHSFYSGTGDFVTQFVTTLDEGGTQTINLATIPTLPDGYTGSVVICSDQPITARLLPTLTITTLADGPNGVIYASNGSVSKTTVDGNPVTATVQLENVAAGVRGLLAIIDVDSGIFLQQQVMTMTGGGAMEVLARFSSSGMAWNEAGTYTPRHTVYATFQPTSAPPMTSNSASFGVRPRPAVLVHGYKDTAASWHTYAITFLSAISVTGFAVDNMNTGGSGNPLSPTLTIDANARQLKQYIAQKKMQYGAEQVDVVAHSMGGLITRHYIARYMTDPSEIHQLIMLGTPNAGSTTAEAVMIGAHALAGNLKPLLTSVLGAFGVRYPAVQELTPGYLEQFNAANYERGLALFYAVAGNYFCLPLYKWPSFNPLERAPNDVVVSRDSVFEIPMNKGWTFPGPQVSGCEGDHRGMRSAAPRDGGQPIFDLYVSPLLRGVTPALQLGWQPSPPQDNLPNATEDALSAVQFTAVQTGTLQPGGRLEFQQTPEPGPAATFIVVGPSDQMTVSLRDPGGRVISPTTSDPQVQYMRMGQDLFPVTTYAISNPVPGLWTTIVEANILTPAGGVPVAAFGSLVSDLRLAIPAPRDAYQAAHPTAVTAQLQAVTTPLLGADVSAQLVRPDGTVSLLTLLDDGLHGDGAPGDGVYGSPFTPAVPGAYNAAIHASFVSAGLLRSRSAIWVTEVDETRLFLPHIQR
ncbi:MAG: alpha/beta fold hydrolase [Chloroflexi bacterium]|nr:alpha/beta fold hydrolase [Chloroflexota bacterium]